MSTSYFGTGSEKFQIEWLLFTLSSMRPVWRWSWHLRGAPRDKGKVLWSRRLSVRHLQQCRMTAAVRMVAAEKKRRGCIAKTLRRKHRRGLTDHLGVESRREKRVKNDWGLSSGWIGAVHSRRTSEEGNGLGKTPRRLTPTEPEKLLWHLMEHQGWKPGWGTQGEGWGSRGGCGSHSQRIAETVAGVRLGRRD